MCLGCTNNFVNDVLSNPNIKIPVKCCFCNKEIEADKFEARLNAKQGAVYFKHFLTKWASKSYKIFMECIYCSYNEIWNLTDQFFICKNKDCGKSFCCGCKREVRHAQIKKILHNLLNCATLHFIKIITKM
jgi:hypothetical protein